MTALLRKLTIRNKLSILAGFGIIVVLFITGSSLTGVHTIGRQLEQVAEQDIPLTNAVADITVLQLEQAINYERAARYAEDIGDDTIARNKYIKSKETFLSLAKEVDEKILAAEEQVQAVLSHTSDSAVKEEFGHVYDVLKKIETEHKAFDDHVKEAFVAFEEGRVYKARSLGEQIEREEAELDRQLEALQAELGTFAQQAALKAENREKLLFKKLTITTVIALIVMLGLSMVTLNSINRPLARIRKAMRELSEGNLKVQIPEHRQEDEIADLVAALRVFRDNALKTKELEEEQKKTEERAREERKKAMLELADRFESEIKGIVESVASASTELSQAAEVMSGTMSAATEKASNVASASEQTATNVQVVASASEELSTSIASISQQVSQSTDAVTQTVERTQRADETLKSLVETTQQISNVAELITDIAEQINLLALNATIESARAGEAGKGFAVVANEVKELATQVGKAVSSVNEQIESVQSVSDETVQALEDIRNSISGLNEISSSIASAIEQQNAVTNEIATNMGTASTGTQEINDNILGVSQAANDATSSAEQVLTASRNLSEESERLSKQVDHFLSEVRSG